MRKSFVSTENNNGASLGQPKETQSSIYSSFSTTGSFPLQTTFNKISTEISPSTSISTSPPLIGPISTSGFTSHSPIENSPIDVQASLQFQKKKKKRVYTIEYLRTFQKLYSGGPAPEDMKWYLNEYKVAPTLNFQKQKPKSGNESSFDGFIRSNGGSFSSMHSSTLSISQTQSFAHSYPLPSTEYSLSSSSPVQVRTCANPWLPRYQSKLAINDPIQEKKLKLLNNVQGVLNKLTLERFEHLSVQLIKYLKEADTSELKNEIIEQIFDKAISEPQFTDMYARLCSRINAEIPQWTENEQVFNFRSILLNLCQSRYETSIAPPKQEEENKEEGKGRKEGTKRKEERKNEEEKE
jgi:hypothetical protein